MTVERSLGLDPISTPASRSRSAYAAGAEKAPGSGDLLGDIIDFNSESSTEMTFLAFTTAVGLSPFTDIPSPKAPAPKVSESRPLPRIGARGEVDVSEHILIASRTAASFALGQACLWRYSRFKSGRRTHETVLDINAPDCAFLCSKDH